MFEIDEKAVSDAVSFTPKEVGLPVPPPPPPMPVVTSASPPAEAEVTTEVTSPSPPKALVVTPPPPPPPLSTTTSAPLSDLPIATLAVPLLAAFAAATFLMRGRVDKDATSSPAPATKAAPAPAPAPIPEVSSNVVDLSIPYDAAAKMAYEESDKSMEYEAFKGKFEADAVADVIAKNTEVDA